MKATVALGMTDCPVSWDTVLKMCGQQIALDEEFCDDHVKERVRLDRACVAQGRALAPTKDATPKRKRQ